MTTLTKGTMQVRILADGTVRVETGDMAGITHQAADAFLKDLAKLLGGVEDVTKAEHGHHHHHEHDHTDHHHHH